MRRYLTLAWLSDLDLPTQIRLRTTFAASGDYLVNVLLLAAFAAAGTISYAVPLTILAVALILNAAIISSIASGVTLRMADPSITGVQVTAACGINLLGLFLAPQIAYLFIINLFVPLSFGSLHFSRRGFLIAWALLAVSLSIAMAVLGERVDFTFLNPADQWLTCAVVVLAFGRFLAINAEVSHLRVRLHKKNKELAQAAMQLAELATHDELTGIWNRRQFVKLLQDELSRSRRSRSSFYVAVIDADHFSAINQTFGWKVGDAVLVELARLIEATLRCSDRIGRYGGEEFIAMLVDTRPEAFLPMIERVRATVEAHSWEGIAPGLRVTVSIGFTVWHPDDTHLRILNRIEAALYRAKNAGRNRIEEERY